MDHNFSPLQVKEHLTSALAREPNFSLLVIGYSLGRMCSKQDANYHLFYFLTVDQALAWRSW